MMQPPKNRDARALRTYALTFPEAHEDFPWGERVVKVRDKVFVFLGRGDDEVGRTLARYRRHVSGAHRSGWLGLRRAWPQ